MGESSASTSNATRSLTIRMLFLMTLNEGLFCNIMAHQVLIFKRQISCKVLTCAEFQVHIFELLFLRLNFLYQVLDIAISTLCHRFKKRTARPLALGDISLFNFF